MQFISYKVNKFWIIYKSLINQEIPANTLTPLNTYRFILKSEKTLNNNLSKTF